MVRSPESAHTPGEARNLAAVRQSFERWTRGEGSVFDLLVPDMTWTIEGSSPSAGRYDRAGLDALLKPFNAHLAGLLVPQLRELCADGDRVIALFDASAPRKNGEPYENSYAWFLTMREQRIVAVVAFLDLVAFDDVREDRRFDIRPQLAACQGPSSMRLTMAAPRPDRRGSDRASRAVLVLNGLGIAAAAAFATTGLARPDYARPGASVSSLTSFWSTASAIRTWSLAAPLLIALLRGTRPAPELLTVAGLVQLGDSALGIWQKNPPMAVFPAAMGLVHLTSARLLSTPKERLK